MNWGSLSSEEMEDISWYAEYLMRGGLTDFQIEFFIGAGYIPNASQLEFHAAVNECRPGGVKEILMEGNRGGGKSFSQIKQAACDCMEHPGLKVLFLRKVKGNAKEALADLSIKALKNIPHEVQQKEVVFPNGSRIIMKGYNTSKDILQYLGMEADLYVFDELTMIREEDYGTILTSLRNSRNEEYYPRVYASTNPGGVGHRWVKTHFVLPKRENRETTTRCIHSDVEDNSRFMGDYKQTVLANLKGSERERWFLGNWDINEGAAFHFNYSIHTCEWGGPMSFMPKGGNRKMVDINDSWVRIGGLDLGTTKPYCYLWGAVNNDLGRVYVYREDYKSGLTTKQQATRIIQKTGENEDMLASYCDPAMVRKHDDDLNKSSIDDYAQYGVILTPGSRERQSGKWKIDNLLELRADGLPGLIIHPSCVELIKQLDSLTVDPNNPEDVDTKEEDHAYDALRYMLSRYREPKMYVSTPPAPSQNKASHFSAMSALFG